MVCTPRHFDRVVRRAALLKAEEDAVQKMCEQIAAFKPDLVITEKVGEGKRVRVSLCACHRKMNGACARGTCAWCHV